jgi:hypothetical protein
VKDGKMNIWRDYFDGLFNDGNDGIMPMVEYSFDDTNNRFVQRIRELEIKEVIKRRDF